MWTRLARRGSSTRAVAHRAHARTSRLRVGGARAPRRAAYPTAGSSASRDRAGRDRAHASTRARRGSARAPRRRPTRSPGPLLRRRCARVARPRRGCRTRNALRCPDRAVVAARPRRRTRPSLRCGRHPRGRTPPTLPHRPARDSPPRSRRSATRTPAGLARSRRGRALSPDRESRGALLRESAEGDEQRVVLLAATDADPHELAEGPDDHAVREHGGRKPRCTASPRRAVHRHKVPC